MISVTVDSARALAALERLAQSAANPRPALLAIGEKLTESTKQRFVSSTAPDGARWAPNKASTLARKGAGKKVLVNNSILSTTIHYAVDDHGVSIGSALEYAAMQQFGGSKSRFPNLWGDIPARPFLGVSQADEDTIERVVEDYLRKAIP
jgi:phage virion morphogenesis protein